MINYNSNTGGNSFFRIHGSGHAAEPKPAVCGPTPIKLTRTSETPKPDESPDIPEGSFNSITRPPSIEDVYSGKKFTNKIFKDLKFPSNITNASFTECTFTNCTFSTEFARCKFNWCIVQHCNGKLVLRRAIIENSTKIHSCDMVYLRIHDSQITRSKFQYLWLEDFDLTNCSVTDSSFQDMTVLAAKSYSPWIEDNKILRSRFITVKTRKARFQRNNLHKTTLMGVSFAKGTVKGNAFNGCRFGLRTGWYEAVIKNNTFKGMEGDRYGGFTDRYDYDSIPCSWDTLEPLIFADWDITTKKNIRLRVMLYDFANHSNPKEYLRYIKRTAKGYSARCPYEDRGSGKHRSYTLNYFRSVARRVYRKDCEKFLWYLRLRPDLWFKSVRETAKRVQPHLPTLLNDIFGYNGNSRPF